MATTPFNTGTTASICLGNYLPQATKFKISGVQAGRIQTVEVTLKPFSFQWSDGWEIGPDKMVNVETTFFSKCFSPFEHPGNVALFLPR